MKRTILCLLLGLFISFPVYADFYSSDFDSGTNHFGFFILPRLVLSRRPGTRLGTLVRQPNITLRLKIQTVPLPLRPRPMFLKIRTGKTLAQDLSESNTHFRCVRHTDC